MNSETQQLILSFLATDLNLFVMCKPILHPSYFDVQYRKPIKFLLEYFDKHKVVPSLDILKASTGFSSETLERNWMSKEDREWAANSIEEHCKRRAIEAAIANAPDLLIEEKYTEIELSLKQALQISLRRDLGTDYFADPKARLEKMKLENKPIPTTWTDLDGFLGGGLCREELLLFSAPPGVGKSMTMLNLGVNLLAQGYSGVYFSLEMSEGAVSKRADAMISEVKYCEIFDKVDEVAEKLEAVKEKYGKFYVKRFPESTTTANHLRAYIREFIDTHGFCPDFFVVDYIDLMAPTVKISMENMFTKDKFVAEEVRSLTHEFCMIGISASQLGRSAIGADASELSQANIQGGMSKVNTCDNMIAIVQNEQMKAAFEYMFKLLKTRNSNGVGHCISLSWNPDTLRITTLLKPSFDESIASLQDKAKQKIINKASLKDVLKMGSKGSVT